MSWHTTLIIAAVVLLAGCTGGMAGSVDNTGAPDVSATETSTTTAAATPDGSLQIHFINVGQSASTLIIGPAGETMLIDTGDFRNDGEYTLEYLQQNGIDRIDHLVVTHNDADHIGGNAAVIEYYETEADGIGAIYDPGIAASTQTYERYLDAVEEYNVDLFEVREGDTLPFEDVETRVLGPPDPYLDTDSRNENGIVLHFTFGQTSLLHTGDSEEKQEAYLVDEYGETLDATIYKAGHHGSDSSSSAELLDLVSPEVAVISSAYDSQYGHPHEEVLERFGERSIPTYWTATHGSVVMVSDGSTVSVRTQAAAPTDPLAIREGDPVEPGSTMPVEERAVITPDGVEEQTATGTETATATPTPTQTAIPDGGSDPGALALVEIHADAAGTESENLNDEYLVFENTGDSELDLSGWTVADAADHVYTVPEGTTLAPGGQVTLHTGSGTDTETDLYWGAAAPVWNNGGDTVTVRTADGTVVIQEDYN
ncbi:lamin tail domain-containing protein [Halobaculum limi]|uniref:lamin tail domain-containing protein n=1 Tax=Halobaculum limi TaxID=3031916 RepID=UPI0024062934|nr:lamin tail domain-containing protein [Halobaculum sp. YSMS11]